MESDGSMTLCMGNLKKGIDIYCNWILTPSHLRCSPPLFKKERGEGRLRTSLPAAGRGVSNEC